MQNVLWALRVAQVRLRFLFVLAAGFLIVGKWHVLRNYWETLTTPSPGRNVNGGVSAESEYFCPMCPGVISVWPTNCSVCNMPLVRRKKSDAQQLPDGVLARMQISPYRVHLAGIQTAPVGYRPLVREVVARGVVQASEASVRPEATRREAAGASSAEDETACIITAEIEQRQIPFVRPGSPVVLEADMELAGEPMAGRILQVHPAVSPQTHRVPIEAAVSDEKQELWPGMQVNLRIRRPLAELEPFRSQPADPPPLAEGELRKLYTCSQHPHVLREKRERCPDDHSLLMDLPLGDLERVAWWCPMHPEVTAKERGHTCDECNGMQLVPRIVRYRPAGEVLAVPQTAVVDLGDRRVVFVERMPGMFDAVEVVVGPRCDGYYPVVRGLLPEQRVAATGAFLLDAETRLNPSVAAGYFGASLARSSVDSPAAAHHDSSKAAEILAALAKLSAHDRASAERQKLCPITGMPLGSMGTPIKIDIHGQTVWLCCAGCTADATENPEQVLDKLRRLTSK
jgi:Cu(I)/Ag(I) efflux system membrane fusion protein